MFGWIRKFRRRQLLKQPFPENWNAILQHNALFLDGIEPASQIQLRNAIQILVAEKNWEGCGGLEITDEHRVTIAAQIARMMLGFDNDYFSDIRSVLLYPAAYVAKSQNDIGSGVVMEGHSGRLGEAWHRGPVILSWNDVLASGRHENRGQNVVIHEFAHQLDMRNGRFADGIPAIESAALAQQWKTLLERDSRRLQHYCGQGIPTVLDCYGATNHAEFFAVASEAFFESPSDLYAQWPDLFSLLQRFYRGKAALAKHEF